jgi:hypothetical protein
MNAERKLAHIGTPDSSSMQRSTVRPNTFMAQPKVQTWPSEIDDDYLFGDSSGDFPPSIPQGFTMDNDMLISGLDLDFAPGDLTMPDPQPWAVGDQGMFF